MLGRKLELAGLFLFIMSSSLNQTLVHLYFSEKRRQFLPYHLFYIGENSSPIGYTLQEQIDIFLRSISFCTFYIALSFYLEINLFDALLFLL